MSAQPSRAHSGNGRLLATAIATVIAAGFAAPASAVPIQTDNWTGSWDTTVSYGAIWRVQSPDCRLIANANGGCGRSANNDDGNLNFDTGLVSSAIKATSEIQLNFRDSWGIFARGTAFHDGEAGDTNRTDISDGGLDRVEQGGRMLDYFVYVPFTLGSMPGEFRIGDQVISWGESTFIQGGVNLTNPVDVGKLRVPGAELKEALVPQGMAYFNLSPTVNFSIEAYYQYVWENVVPDPVGSYFATSDLAHGRISAPTGHRSAAPSTPTSCSCRVVRAPSPTTAASTAWRCAISPRTSWAAWSSASITCVITAGCRWSAD